MFRILALALLFAPACKTAPKERSGGDWVFSTETIWESPPPELQKSYVEGDGEIAVFQESGEFAWLSVTLFRDRATGTVSICRGCGFSTRKGTWAPEGRLGLVVTSKWAHRHLAVLGKEGPDPRANQIWIVTGRRADGSPESLAIDGFAYGRLDNLPDPAMVAEFLGSD